MMRKMDHGPKIEKLKTPLKSKGHKLPFANVTDPALAKDEPIVEDHRLVNWERWLKRREGQYRALDKTDSQCTTEMVMNSCEKIRPKMEMRNLMEHATIPVPSVSNKYRGDPGFWKLPQFLPSRGNFCPSEIGPVLTKKELNLLPTLEYVDVPMCIRAEKNLLNPLQKVPVWQSSSYLKKRKEELADTIAILQPTTPETANLIARGQRFGQEEEYVADIPVISIMDLSLGKENSQVEIEKPLVSTGLVLTLRINGFEIRKDEESTWESSAPEEITWTLDFSSKINQRAEKYLHIENAGTVAITYKWRSASLTPELLPISSKNHASFFFNKNEALILPGQKVALPVWFQKRQVGIFSESWRMETEPIVSRSAFIIRMCGYATSEDVCTSQTEVDMYLDGCIRNTAVRETLDEIINSVMPSEPPEPAYESLYLEGELFEAKNPSHFYHASLVTQLHRLYETTSASDVSSWKLSLRDLRNVLLQIENPNLRHEKLKLFSDLCQRCLELRLSNPLRNSKHVMVYNVLCTFLNRMEEESDFAKRHCIPKEKESVKPTETRIRSSLDPSPPIVDAKSPQATPDSTSCYREVFYVRIYELFIEAVGQACAVIDSLNHLNEIEPCTNYG